MRDFSIDLVWGKLQMACAAIGGWLGYFLGGMDEEIQRGHGGGVPPEAGSERRTGKGADRKG